MKVRAVFRRLFPPRPAQQLRVQRAFEARVAESVDFADMTLLRQADEGGDGDRPLQTHRIYRTRDGRYVLFICTAGEPGYLAVLSRERAANALRSSRDIFRREFGHDPGSG